MNQDHSKTIFGLKITEIFCMSELKTTSNFNANILNTLILLNIYETQFYINNDIFKSCLFHKLWRNFNNFCKIFLVRLFLKKKESKIQNIAVAVFKERDLFKPWRWIHLANNNSSASRFMPYILPTIFMADISLQFETH